MGTCYVDSTWQCSQRKSPNWPWCQGVPQPVVSERLAGIRLGVDIGVSHPPSLVFWGLTGSWREGWVMPRAQDTLMGEQPYQAVPNI